MTIFPPQARADMLLTVYPTIQGTERERLRSDIIQTLKADRAAYNAYIQQLIGELRVKIEQQAYGGIGEALEKIVGAIEGTE